VRFSSSPNLFLVTLAMDLKPDTLHQFMAMADGYGQRGFFPDGYDWSGIRDSSQEARVEMGNLARRMLMRHADPKFLAMGLPQEMIDMHIRREEPKVRQAEGSRP
jgi:hypothetical protein